ncbi:MAG: hypothetical protein MJ158_00410 [Alphaproteobacteria bacterium]|nr:hypothetical protein [Alphaproteobacteria bacterium]
MKRVILPILCSVCMSANAEVLDLNTALQNTYHACADIDDNLHDLKVLAGINTAVTSVGTAVGIGATATGFVKAKTDTEIDKLEKILEKLKNIESNMQQKPKNNTVSLQTELNAYYDNHKNDSVEEQQTIQKQIDELTVKSKKLGNWRTGLLAGNTATNVASAIIASKTINKDDLQGQINECISATKALNTAIMQARMNGENITEAQSIYTACKEYEYVDISPINNRGKGAMISSSVGAALGGIGTITSAIANTDKTREDNSEAGKKKEKDLNTASNVLSIGATAASMTSTVFNATQIAAIKKVAKVSESCTGVLK